jgi:hypothetical protein
MRVPTPLRLAGRFVALATLLVGCTGRGASPQPPTAPLSPRLAALPSCEAAFDHVRAVALARMNERLDEELARFERGEGCYSGGGYLDAGASVPDEPPTTPPPGGASQGTGTNNQVAGVDEADFVKNDGRYIYLAQNGVLRIVDAWPAAQMHQVSATPLPGTPLKLFVNGDRALVYVSVPAEYDGTPGSNPYPVDSGHRECTYGYDCDFQGDGTWTRLLVFELGDRSAPSLVRTLELTGSLLAARRVDGAIHTVVTDARATFPELSYVPEESICDGVGSGDMPSSEQVERARTAYERLRAQNAAVIRDKDLHDRLPRFTDTAFAGPGSSQDEAACQRMYASVAADGASFTSIVSLDLAAGTPEPANVATILSSAGAVYASADALYMAVPHRHQQGAPWYGGIDPEDDASDVHKFHISAASADTGYAGSGVVRGRVLNQFAMDEQHGFLRIATTSGHVPDPEVESQLTVLSPDGESLVAVGEVPHIAPAEDIRSVRFDGDRAFVVTFKKTDPLFAFDLSDPHAPRQLGELKIPGFSTYMHMLDGGHLLTIGYDADDHGDFAYFDGVLLQIFDVTDPAAPTLAHKLVIGTRGSSSEALTNHLAFTYYPEKALLSIPMTICEGGDDGTFGLDLTFNGLMVFDIALDTGIAERGRVTHPVADGISCANWWSDARSSVKRSLFLEDFVYSISDADLKVQSIDALGTDVAEVPLATP